MNLNAIWQVAKSGRMGALRSLAGVMSEYTRACFLVAAAHAGVLRSLAGGPLSLEQLAARLGAREGAQAELAAWLDVGVSVGELGVGPHGYRLEGALARAVADAENDDVLAMLEELTDLHQRLVFDAPGLVQRSERLSLSDQRGDVVARSSRMLEPFVRAALERVVPKRGAFRVLEVGCGSGTYLRHMTEQNPELQVVGLELQPVVAEQARENLRRWGVSQRADVCTEDVRDRKPDGSFDLVTLHNNIYYFRVDDRAQLLAHLRGFLRPRGTLLCTTATRGGSPSVSVLNLWGALTEGCGPLPTPEELCATLRQAGFADASSENLAAPFEQFHAFYAM